VNKHATTLLFLFAGAMLFNYGASVPGGQTSATTQSLTQDVSSSTTPNCNIAPVCPLNDDLGATPTARAIVHQKPNPKPVSLAPKTQAR
jgi:hypothetical protein